MLRPPRRLLFQRTARNLCENVEGGVTQHKLCPWWVGYLITSPFRKLWQNRALILESHIRAGMTVLEPGPGMGFFTLEIAKLVGSSGRVVAVDVQPQMIEGLKRRAAKPASWTGLTLVSSALRPCSLPREIQLPILFFPPLSCMRCRPPRPSSPKLPEP